MRLKPKIKSRTPKLNLGNLPSGETVMVLNAIMEARRLLGTKGLAVYVKPLGKKEFT